MSIYRLIGCTSLKPGNLVDMGPIGHRYGIIQTIIKEDYKLPNRCVVTGQIRFIQGQTVNLYSIRGCDKKPTRNVDGYVFGFSS